MPTTPSSPFWLHSLIPDHLLSLNSHFLHFPILWWRGLTLFTSYQAYIYMAENLSTLRWITDLSTVVSNLCDNNSVSGGDVFPLWSISFTEVPVEKTNLPCRLCKGWVYWQLSMLWNTVILLAFLGIAGCWWGTRRGRPPTVTLTQIRPTQLEIRPTPAFALFYQHICFSFFQTVSQLTSSN